MKTFNDYADLAIDRHHLNGIRHLGREIDLTSASMSDLKNGKSLPSEETIIKIAELAGLPKEEALIHLSIWRAERDNNSEVKRLWTRIAKMSGCLSTVLVLSLFSINDCYTNKKCQSLPNTQKHDIYIMRQS